MTDIIEKLQDLNKQATIERSHFYVKSVAEEEIKQIKKLRSNLSIERLDALNIDSMLEELQGQAQKIRDELRGKA